MNIIHLEDSENDAVLVKALLRAEWPDCRITNVTGQSQYEAAIKLQGVDLILSDYSMPGFDGLSALELARTWCPDKPFIFMSGTLGEERAIEALQRGATDYIIKDRPGRLVPAIRQAIERVEAEALRRRNEAHIREQAELLDKARDAICVQDVGEGIIFWNKSAERLYGWTAAEVRNQDVFSLLASKKTPQDAESRRAILEHGEWAGELRHTTKTGRELIVESRLTLIRDDQGQPKSILFINTDVTDQRKLEAQLLRNQRMESIGALTGGIAHDLNNVLSPILMGAELLNFADLGGAARKTVEAITTSARHGSALVRQLLAFARGSEGERVIVQVGPLLADLETLLRQILPHTIRLSIDCAPDCRPVLADATQLKQVVLNLCINARDAMPDGGSLAIAVVNVLVDAALARTLAEGRTGEHVRISVADTGTGMSPEIVERIFDPFFTTKGEGKGTGLGLSTVRGIAKGHGGFLQVESEVGRGTTFHFYLPALMAGQVPPGKAAPAPPESLEGREECILVVDDDPEIRGMMAAFLGHHGYRVITACDGREGLDCFRENQGRIAAVVTDLLMPMMTGVEVIAAVRALDPAVPIVAISGLGVSGKPIPGFDRNWVSAALSKPVEPVVLLETLRRLVRVSPTK